MKQHITLEQLEEISQKQLLSLGARHFNEWYNILTKSQKVGLITNRVDIAYVISSSLTIGKMIEILRNELECFDISPHNNIHIGYTIGTLYKDNKYDPTVIAKSESWLISDHTEEENKKYSDKVYCDALWEAVKEVLTQQTSQITKETIDDRRN